MFRGTFGTFHEQLDAGCHLIELCCGLHVQKDFAATQHLPPGWRSSPSTVCWICSIRTIPSSSCKSITCAPGSGPEAREVHQRGVCNFPIVVQFIAYIILHLIIYLYIYIIIIYMYIYLMFEYASDPSNSMSFRELVADKSLIWLKAILRNEFAIPSQTFTKVVGGGACIGQSELLTSFCRMMLRWWNGSGKIQT